MTRPFYELDPKRLWQRAPWSFVLAGATVSVMTLFIQATHAQASIANVPMLYLLVVIATALFLGRLPAVFASIVSFLCFDWFFVEPRQMLTVQQPAEWLALCTFLLTAIVTGQLTALLTARAEEAQRRRVEMAALSAASWAVASELDRDKALGKVLSKLVELVEPQAAALIIRDESDKDVVIARSGLPDSTFEIGIAGDAIQFVFTSGKPTGLDQSSQRQESATIAAPLPSTYLPIVIENQVLGVLYLRLKDDQNMSDIETQVVDSLRNHAAVILQRDRLMKAEARAQALAEADRLKTALLSMVSHDFRSPLTSIKASVSTLLEEGAPVAPDVQRSLLLGVEQETDRLNRMVGNILDLSRLEAGAWRPRKESVPVAEMIGSALDYFNRDDNNRIQVSLDRSISEVSVDSVQMVQVLKNLLENGLKYSPVDSKVELRTVVEAGALTFEVLDRGRGLPKDDELKIFEPIFRAPGLKESSVPGVGIGLAICKGLIEANGGKLCASNRQGGGTVFRATLPLDSSTEQFSKEISTDESSSCR
jgi:two-component system sensor histidine kinase KdpD